jgi:hypothetical protein
MKDQAGMEAVKVFLQASLLLEEGQKGSKDICKARDH